MADLDLPTGTVTFLFTDLEGSTRLLQAHPAAYRHAVRRHHALLRGAIKARMRLHKGEVEVQGARYFGAPLYRAGRLLATAHGGQVVLSAATAALVRDEVAGGRLRDLGVHRLRDLARPERVAQLLHPELPGEFPPLRSLDARPHNLPRPLTSFGGRERELAEVARLLAAQRLVALTGVGGTGKTRLAVEAAAGLGDAFPDGMVFVDLAPLRDPDLVVATIGQALGRWDAGPRPLLDTLQGVLAERALLLVLDNFEQLLPAAPAVGELLGACPGVTALATSRAPLRLRWERLVVVAPLALPDRARLGAPGLLAPAPAVALLVARESAVGSSIGAGWSPW
jgi:hypothetical protein